MKNQTNAPQGLMATAILFFACMAPFARMAAQPVVFNHPTSHGGTGNYLTTWTVPAGVTSVTLEAWGGGGGGNGNSDLPTDALVGGGGGAYAKIENYTVTPGQQLSISVGYGGSLQTGGFADVGLPGGFSSVSAAGVAVVNACGGTYMNPIAGSYQANTCTPVGAVEDGQYPVGTSRLSATAAGGNAGGMAAGGGAGGAAGQLGQVPGGGGGGGFKMAKTGAAGRVIITPNNSVGLASQEPFQFARLHPNPFSDVAHLHLGEDNQRPFLIKIFDMAGRMMEVKNISAESMRQNISFGSSLTPGVYLLSLSAEGVGSIRFFRLVKN